MYDEKDNALGFEENKKSALKGGRAAGTARKAFEKKRMKSGIAHQFYESN